MNTLTTTLHYYCFDTRDQAQAEAYRELCEKLGNTPGRGHWMESHGNGSHYRSLGGHYGENWSHVVELETKYLFGNQWNTRPTGYSEQGLRVFDWAQDYMVQGSKYIKRGHYLEITDEMREVRRNTVKCGYCGHQKRAAQGHVFCPDCLDSEYLQEKDLFLLRLVPVDRERESRQPLTEAERAHLMPQYVEAQTKAEGSRAVAARNKKREAVEKKYKKELAAVTEERDGMIWLMDNGVNVGNCIYYSHTRRFSFGWRQLVSPEVESKLLDILVEFPFSYEIRGTNGKREVTR